MSITVSELRGWLKQFNDSELIAVDEGGLTLVQVNGSATYEIGGEPDRQSSLFSTEED